MAKTEDGAKELSFFRDEGKAGTRKTTFFDMEQSPEFVIEGIENMIEVPDAITENVDVADYFRGQIKVQPLVMHQDDNGFSAGAYAFEPNFVMPRHRHSSDQIVLILDGEMRQGSKVLSKGSGFFTPAGAAYGFTVGPEGCRILEFRDRTNFSTVYVDDDPAAWKKAESPGS